eukprot:GEMP01076537.1.p2 GENE.GEMP01076537.1~~GEMP01076537.1.p2  ORF type:complete len:130 (-),score=12.45 GEMP01076537.1:124-513(-)
MSSCFFCGRCLFLLIGEAMPPCTIPIPNHTCAASELLSGLPPSGSTSRLPLSNLSRWGLERYAVQFSLLRRILSVQAEGEERLSALQRVVRRRRRLRLQVFAVFLGTVVHIFWSRTGERSTHTLTTFKI